MHRRDLLDRIRNHVPFDAAEAESRAQIERFVRDHPDCFERSLPSGHVTGSAWLVNRANTHVLLTHHRKLGLWVQLGGHADGHPDVLAVAIREAREESGLESIVPVSTQVFDVDVHEIPPRDGEPAHRHYDIRFLLTTRGSERITISDESLDLRWVEKSGVEELNVDASVLRMLTKWRTLRAPVKT